MVNSYRVKDYTFPVGVASTVGSVNTQYTPFVVNGDILKIDCMSNFTGSLILAPSGNNVANVLNAFCNFTTASGTNKVQSFPFINTTGSFTINSPLMLVISGLMSGTAITYGPITVLYR